MHSKLKGNIAEAVVELDLKKRGFCVFREIGDLSKIDLIAEKYYKLLTFQVKGITPNKEGSLRLQFSKSGPNYSFNYDSKMFDYFAVVNLTSLEVCYIPSYLMDSKKSINIRIQKSKNNQILNTFDFNDFTDLKIS